MGSGPGLQRSVRANKKAANSHEPLLHETAQDICSYSLLEDFNAAKPPQYIPAAVGVQGLALQVGGTARRGRPRTDPPPCQLTESQLPQIRSTHALSQKH